MGPISWNRRLLFLLILPASAWALSGCAGPERPECPHTWNFPQIARSLRVRDLTLHLGPGMGPMGDQVSVAPGTTDIPEFHDCQRLIVSKSVPEKYDSLYALFGGGLLDSLFRDSLILNPDTGEVKAYPVAEIFSYNGTYPALAISPLWNCLFLAVRQNGWVAVMRNDGEDEGDCRTPVLLSALAQGSATLLEVHRDAPTGYNPDQVPFVARWEWDPEAREQVIGVACGLAWCEIGRPRFRTEPPPVAGNGPFGPGSGAEYILRFKGWYDEQELGTVDRGRDIHPSGVRGYVIPIGRLGSFSTYSAFNEWQTVAYVALSHESSSYQHKLNFVAGSLDAPPSTLAICQLMAGCVGVPPNLISSCAPDVGPSGSTRWWLRISTATDTLYKCATRRGSTETVPGTARWRWLADDETTWMRCTNGCCEGRP